MTEATREYVVTAKHLTIRKGAPALPIGATVELTDKQALARVNKVRLKTDASEQESALVTLSTQLIQAQEEVTRLSGVEEDLASAKAEITRLGKGEDIKAARAANEALNIANTELSKANEALTIANTELDEKLKAATTKKK